MDIIKGMRDSMVFTYTFFTSTRMRSPSYTHHIKGYQGPQHHQSSGSKDFFKNIIIIFKVSISLKTYPMVPLYIFITIRVPTPQKRDKDLTTSLQHLVGFICMITRLQHANDHIASKGHQTTIYVGSRPKLSRTPSTP